jgi:hypothetical protein
MHFSFAEEQRPCLARQQLGCLRRLLYVVAAAGCMQAAALHWTAGLRSRFSHWLHLCYSTLVALWVL